MEYLGKIALVALGGGLIYAGIRLVNLAFRLWRLGITARAAIAALIAAVYTLSPVDAIPDVIVGIGWIDDLIVLGMAGLYIWRILSRRKSVRPSRPLVIPQLPPR